MTGDRWGARGVGRNLTDRGWVFVGLTLLCSLWWSGVAFAQLTPPAQISPSDVIGDSTPTYRWSVVPGSTWYRLWVNDLTGNVINRWYTSAQVNAGSGECSVTPSEVVSGSGTWWVQGWDASQGNGPWSVGLDFTVGALLAAPDAISPSGVVSDSTPTYRWSEVPGSTWYRLWVNDSTGTVINRWYTSAQVNAGSGECSVTPSEVVSGSGTWWVQGWDASQGNGPWSVGLNFTVGAPLTPPAQISPSGVIGDSTPTYRWSVVPGATWYRLWVNNSTGNVINRWYTSAQVNAGSGECSVTPAEAVIGTGTWWVQGWNASQGNGPWSVGLNFNVSGGGLGWATVLEYTPNPAVIADSEWRERIIATGLPWRVRDNASQIEMLLVPPGTFMMGCSPSNQHGCSSLENPVHEVMLTRAFYLGRYEVTQAQWTAVMGTNPSAFQNPSAEVPAAQVPFRPVEQVSWFMIQGFEAATGLRLPTEAEWEYACRAGTTTAFNLPPNGTDDDSLLSQLAWFDDNSASQTRPVGQKQANNLGLHDMHGNLWEWCEDWYGTGYYWQSPAVDPPGPTSGESRVVRGGSWNFNSDFCRASGRNNGSPGNGGNLVGFRVARAP